MHYEPIRCATCGCVAIGKDEGVRAGSEEHKAMRAEIDQRRKRMRAEGKDYVTQDGDVMLFRFNV